MSGNLLPRAALTRLWGHGLSPVAESALAGAALPRHSFAFLAEVGIPRVLGEFVAGLGIQIELRGDVFPRLSDLYPDSGGPPLPLASYLRFGSCHDAHLCLNQRGEVVRIEVISRRAWGYEDRQLNSEVESFVDFLYILEVNAGRLLAAADTPLINGLIDEVTAELARVDPAAMTPSGWWPAILDDMRE